MNPLKQSPSVPQAASCLQFSADGTRLYVGRHNSLIEVWDTRTKKLLMTWTDHTVGVNAVALSPDGRLAASGGGVNRGRGYEDCDLRVWRTSDGALLARVKGPQTPIHQIAFMADGKKVVSGSGDQTVWIWDLTPILPPQGK